MADAASPSADGSPHLAISLAGFFGTQQRKEDDVADGAGVGEEHGQAVHADAFAARGGHPITQGANIVLVHSVRGEVALPATVTPKAAE